ncbi:MAG: translation initiation factor IF-2 [bacterium]
MSKIRVHELAKQMDISSKELIKILGEMGIEVKNHMSALENEEVEKVTASRKKAVEEKNKKENRKDNKKAAENKPAAKDGGKPKHAKPKKPEKKADNKKKPEPKKQEQPSEPKKAETADDEIKILTLDTDKIVVKDLAEKINMKPNQLVMKLMKKGLMVSINQSVDVDKITDLVEECGYLIDIAEKEPEAEISDIEEIIDAPESLLPRPPVVTIMGHVDHGKTSLLDAIRKTKVTATEAGGITQHIGAYQVNLQGKKITFLDTPGHEAFTAMRARGAQSTDIAILVVAADDGIMPQTIEAINHAKAAGVPIIVAINKIDRPEANPDKVKQELTEHGLIPEEWGGDTICVEVSAKQKLGLDDLLEMILLVAEMLELKANPNRLAEGVIVEAQVDKGRGPVATVLVQKGTLKVGDFIVVGSVFGKVRAMVNDKGERVKKAVPATPVEVLGLSEVPEAGDILVAMKDEKRAKSIVESRKQKKREVELLSNHRVTLDDLFNQIQEGTIKDLNIIIKADVQGSVEALKESLEKQSIEEVRVNVIHGGVGGITESDVLLAAASNAIILGFNVRPAQNVAKAAENENVDIRLYRVIYNAIEDIEAAIKGMLEPTYKENILGHAEVRALFKVPKVGTIAGCYVTDGKITRQSSVRLLRDSVIVYEGKLESLKRFKDDAKEVASGFECGIGLEKFNDVKEGDTIEAFIFEEEEK